MGGEPGGSCSGLGGQTEVRVGVDVGGTFTDLVLLSEDGEILTRKLLTTPDDYGRAVVGGVGGLPERLGLPGSGGRGDPLRRDAARVPEDVLDEKLSPEYAREVYGVESLA